MKFPYFFRDNLKIQATTLSSLATIIIFLTIAFNVFLGEQPQGLNALFLVIISLGASVYIGVQNLLVVPRIHNFGKLYYWINAIVSGLGLGFLVVILDDKYLAIFSILLILSVTSISILSGRGPAYLMTFISGTIYASLHIGETTLFIDIIFYLAPIGASIVVTETLLHLKQVTQDHINRLEKVNRFSQQINSSLQTEQVLTILNAAIQGALDADTYFVGLLEGDELKLELCYDEDEYYTEIRAPLKGTLSEWVLRNNQPLLLRDLRQDLDLEGIEIVLVGKDKSSLSWLGVPMVTSSIKGIIAVGSYQVHAFNQTDLELLSNLAQHAALALDKAVQHEKVEDQSRLDSLTGTLNHGYFLASLQEAIEFALAQKQTLGLIMLDIDYFKQYNDSFGHQVGDMVLIKLCDTIRSHIKSSDMVGRWGGEEFIIALPGASGQEAYRVAERIQKTMSQVVLNGNANENIPAPTVSQGISVFPDEAEEINRLIYLADKRLYVAKERGRNQIEGGHPIQLA